MRYFAWGRMTGRCKAGPPWTLKAVLVGCRVCFVSLCRAWFKQVSALAEDWSYCLSSDEEPWLKSSSGSTRQGLGARMEGWKALSRQNSEIKGFQRLQHTDLLLHRCSGGVYVGTAWFNAVGEAGSRLQWCSQCGTCYHLCSRREGGSLKLFSLPWLQFVQKASLGSWDLLWLSLKSVLFFRIIKNVYIAEDILGSKQRSCPHLGAVSILLSTANLTSLFF